MPRVFMHMSFFLFTITAISGLWMRFVFVRPVQAVPYTNVLHGHSHLAILGWAFLGVFIIFLALFWNHIKRKRQAIALVSTLFIVSLAMFGAFVYQGYDVFSIVLSTLHIFVEYWGAIFIYRELSSTRQVSKQGKFYIYGSLVALFISSIGPFSLGFIAANGLKESNLFDMAIYFYLHFQYNGWLFLALIGLFIFILQKRRIYHSRVLLQIGFWIYVLCLLPGYFSSVLWADLGSPTTLLANVGVVGQWIAILCILFAFRGIWKKLSTQFASLTVVGLYIVFGLLFLKSTMELGLISPSLANLIYETRDVIIGYLHFTLLGFISIFIMIQFQMVQITQVQKDFAKPGFLIFFIGFLWNEGLLFYSGLTHWISLPTLPFYRESLIAASLLLFCGVLITWSTISKKNRSF